MLGLNRNPGRHPCCEGGYHTDIQCIIPCLHRMKPPDRHTQNVRVEPPSPGARRGKAPRRPLWQVRITTYGRIATSITHSRTQNVRVREAPDMLQALPICYFCHPRMLEFAPKMLANPSQFVIVRPLTYCRTVTFRPRT